MPPSKHELFWNNEAYAVIGNSARKPFPKLTFAALKAHGKTAYAVDPGADSIAGERAHPDIASVIEAATSLVTAAVIEVPQEETRDWIARCADAGIRQVWIHMGRETREALELAKEKGLEVCHGTCAVQYLDDSFPHSVHAWIRRMLGRY